MIRYVVRISPEANEDLQKRVSYLIRFKKNPQAARSLLDDFHETRLKLADIAGSLRQPDEKILRSLHLKRLNFSKHNYFLLFRIDKNVVTITNIFHGTEDYESKIK